MASPGGPPTGMVPGAPGAPPVEKPRAGRVGIGVGIVLTVVGLLLGIVAFVMVIVTFDGLLGGPALTVPGRTTVALEPGTKAIYEDSYGRFVTIMAEDVTVTGPGGPVDVEYVPGNETMNVNGTRYVARVQFEVKQSGAYVIEIDDVPPTDAIVGELASASFGRLGAWVIAGLLGGALLVVGFIVFIVGLVRRSKAKRPPPGPGAGWGGPPPGYGYPSGYPQPTHPPRGYPHPGTAPTGWAVPPGSPGAPPGAVPEFQPPWPPGAPGGPGGG